MTAPSLASVPSKPPLSNLQLQLLQLYADGVSDEDLKAIQRLIAYYFADKASDEAAEVWKEKGYTAEQLLEEDMRTPYKSAQR